MAYSVVTNIDGDVANKAIRSDLQKSRTRWFNQHTFTNEITTTPQSLHRLIRAQSGGKIFQGRSAIEIANPYSTGGGPIIFISRCKDNEASPGSPTAGRALSPGSLEVFEHGAEVDFVIWSDTATAGLVATELG